MQPSSKFTFEDVTLNGFNYKRTTADYGTIFPLYSELDTSIAYTMPITLSYRTMTPTLINKQVPQRGLATDTFFQDHYYNNAGHTTQAWSTLGEVIGNPSDDKSCVLYWTFADATLPYYFNGSQGNATIGTSTSKFISGFDISHLIFQANIKGYTKAQYDAYKSTGANQTEGDITLQDLIDNPNDYFVSRFSIQPVACWDDTNHQWRGNPPVYLTCLLDAGEVVQGVASHDAVLFCNQTTASVNYTGINRTGSYHLQCTTQSYKINDSTYYRRLGGIPAELDSNNPYSLGSVTEWHMKPYWDADALRGFLDAQSSNSDNNTNSPELILSTGHGEIYGYDSFNVRQNFSGAPQGQFHYSLWDKKLSAVAYGLEVSSFMASAGCYFQIGNTDNNYYNTLNNNNITPGTLHLRPEIALGTMLEDGTTNGQWVVGEDIEDYEGINKKGDVVHPSFNPSPTPSGNDEDNEDPIPTVGVPFASGLAHYYVTTAASPVLEQISEAMSGWDIDTSKKDLYRNLISCKLIKPPAPIPSAAGLTFTIYGVQPEYQGSPITITGVAGNPTASFGPYTIDRKFNDFRDYAPYTKCEIFLPYCGWCGLPSHVVGRNVSVTYYTDIIAATCKAVVYCGTNIVAEASGVIGVDIPFASENVGAKMQAANAGLVASTKGALQTALGVGTLVSTKGQKGVNTLASGLSSYVSGFTQMSMAANENWTEINGQTGDGCNLSGSSAIIIKITRPKYGANPLYPFIPLGYDNSTGYTSMQSVSVGSVTGLLIADNVDTSGISGATERERAMIKSYLETGIIVNHPE